MSARYGMVIDLDRCTGCGSCMVACAAENNVPALPQASVRTGLTPMLVRKVSNGLEGNLRREASIPIMCMHCEHETPCVQRLSAAGRGSGCSDRDRDADAAALPGLPVLHDGMPIPRALFQLVGSGVAGGHGEDVESGCSDADARRGGEVQFVPRTISLGKEKAAAAGSARLMPPITFLRVWRLVQQERSGLEILRIGMIPSRKRRIPPMRFACWLVSGPSRRFITSRTRLG